MNSNISFLAIISFFLTFYFAYFVTNFLQVLFIFIGSILCVIFVLLNVLGNLSKNPTQTLSQTTLWFYKCNVPDGRNPIMSNKFVSDFLNKFHRAEREFIKEDLKQLFNLYLYQAHYSNLASRTREISLMGVGGYFIFFIIQICLNPFLI